MIDATIICLLKETLTSIRAASNEKSGWQAIISLYEKAIKNAENNTYFSVRDASRIYLEFDSNYTADVFKLMEKTADEVEQYFQKLLCSYMTNSVSSNRLNGKLKEFAKHSDIYEELINDVLASERFDRTNALVVEGYTAKQLTNETILTPLGAFNYLVYLREESEKALANLKAGLLHRKVFNETDMTEVHKNMD